ncbi:unnamed protein product [Fusarium graminearum]|uniref:Chromosome 1, complete genome n=1 Tax=Gibberella zeae (strain ATCC MYA-4620 / CBS 123657 / FGSC 9075 / NRRL 31084 / PH-1) TaxID=229533 RepID=A0A0E0RSB8_GIBZE|nr:hypothetical protein FG05_30007 [Fusarium graminearum]CEF74143.1 unnamed protein product [Fusarium graminearum]CZS77410.1 unnamed protein product [Fusarium graminearum]
MGHFLHAACSIAPGFAWGTAEFPLLHIDDTSSSGLCTRDFGGPRPAEATLSQERPPQSHPTTGRSAYHDGKFLPA